MMYSVHKRALLNAIEVEYSGLELPDVGIDTNIYYKACNDLFLCENDFFQNTENGEKTYYTLEKCCEEKERRYVEEEIFDCCLDTHTNIISTSDLLNGTLCCVMTFLKDHLPPFITIKKDSTLMFSKDDAGNYFVDVDICGGMINPKLTLVRL